VAGNDVPTYSSARKNAALGIEYEYSQSEFTVTTANSDCFKVCVHNTFHGST